jgi:hypothetical protein
MVDGSRARVELGFQPGRSLRETIRAVYAQLPEPHPLAPPP